MGEIWRFYVDFFHQPLEEYQKFKASPSPRGEGCVFVSEVWSHG